MHVETVSLAERWWYALEPASWPQVFAPSLPGQAVGAVHAGRPSAGALALGAPWRMADVASIVLLSGRGGRAVEGPHRAIRWGMLALSGSLLLGGRA